MKISLSRDYIIVKYSDENGSFSTCGGNQKLHPEDGIKKDGCGPLAAADLISYIEKKFEYSGEEYENRASQMCRSFFPYKPGHGTSGFVIQKGLNRYFRENGIVLRATWGVPRHKLFSAIADQLKKDIPVIITVGPKYPGIKPRHSLPLYQKNEAGELLQVKSTSSHYMVVTAIDENLLRVSSWGDVYYIRFEEYLDYARKHSFYFFTNIMVIS